MFTHLSIQILLLAFVPWMSAQVPFPRNCPNVTIPDNFDLDAYMGIWYEHSKYPFAFEIGKKCIYATYKNVDNNTVSVVNSAINRLTQSSSNITGKATVIAPGQLAVSFYRNQNTNKPNYIVLGTDYQTYSVVYTCSNFSPFMHIKIVWILTRERQPSEETIADAKKILELNNISQAFLFNTIQNNCPDPNDAKGIDASTETDLDITANVAQNENLSSLANTLNRA